MRPAAASPQAALLNLGWEGRRAGLLFRVNPPQPCRRRSLTVNAGGKRSGIHQNYWQEMCKAVLRNSVCELVTTLCHSRMPDRQGDFSITLFVPF